MKIKTVTITGADDKTNHSDLVKLSEMFPFVEWGILFSPKRKGEPRYPTIEWVYDLELASQKINMNLSAHLCGGYTKEMITTGYAGEALSGDLKHFMLTHFFGRYQLNFNATKHSVCDKFYEPFGYNTTVKILQYNKSNYEVCKKLIEEYGYNKNIHFLYDGSGGRGNLPNQWQGVVPNHFTGYAGGLSPDNLQAELEKISLAVGDNQIWIDTESGVRTNDILDLDKVTKFLTIAEKFTK